MGVDDTPVARQTAPRLTTVGYADERDVVVGLAQLVATDGSLDDLAPTLLRIVRRGRPERGVSADGPPRSDAVSLPSSRRG